MIDSQNIKEIHDFYNSSDCFPGVEVKGGICYFVIEISYKGKTKFVSHKNNAIVSTTHRYLKEYGYDIIIRYNDAISILNKIRDYKEKTFDNLVSTKKPFGLTTNYRSKNKKGIKVYANKRIEFATIEEVTRRNDDIYSHKVIVPKAVGSGDSYTDVIRPIYCEPGSICTETYLLIGPFENKKICDNIISYIDTKFFHFLVTLQKNTQDCMKKVYSFVPIQDFSKSWTDEELYQKYKLTQEEIDFIESMIKPME